MKVVLKDSVTRKEFRKFNAIMFKGAKSTPSGELDQASMLGNIDEQKDELILLWVKLFEDKELTQEVLDGMPVENYDKLYDKCELKHTALTEKKN